jgi:hypothetical protein
MSFTYLLIETTNYLQDNNHIRYNPYLSPEEWEKADYNTRYYKPTTEELINSYAQRGYEIERIEWLPDRVGDAVIILKAKLPINISYDQELDPTYKYFRDL